MADPHRDESVNPDDLLQDAVADLLRRIPERWAEYDADTLTATESQALALLVAAGMVERRIRLRARLHNHPVAVEATITATGEFGFAEAMEPVLASMWGEWMGAYRAWRAGETRGAPLSVTEHLKPDEWRLTDQGVLARADLDGGHADRVLDFVLRRGFFDGQPRLTTEPGRVRISRREPVRGYGRLVTMRKVQADDAALPAVAIANWKEGADALATAFETMVKAAFEAKAAAEGWPMPDTTPKTPETPRPTHSPDFTSVDWFGTRYTFAKGNQAESVRVLWEAWASGGHSLSQETIGDRIGSTAARFELSKVFRRKTTDGGYEPHPAWGTMIQQDSKGSYRLAPPE